ncbi:RAP1-interacting factor 1 [Babesia microti strain RI]|uniref:RAP1-interacting factor 1 n=1 Tax=Babesia microti (strain RI) TaxID=1133968 RepID=I7IF84_BABMR|nr:RAP1-interacting factor 1 [Babesia microti strain RI]CCF72581.1 RAP1-interacting factor 1 [Babesia microti strain RI]|eukprot:XP_012647190.1 RAP1-interacting factor 1 [Babesia microti strain RI]
MGLSDNLCSCDNAGSEIDQLADKPDQSLDMVSHRTVDEYADRSKASEISQSVDRQWIAVTTYQPVDIVTKTVEVPVIKTVEKFVHKPVIQEKIVHVPREVTQIVEKIVEIPDVKYVEKIVEVPQVQYRSKFVPKIEVVEKIIEKPTIIEKWTEKKVEVPQIKEVVRYKEIDESEEVIKYFPQGKGNIDWEKECAMQSHMLPEHDANKTTVLCSDKIGEDGVMIYSTPFANQGTVFQQVSHELVRDKESARAGCIGC